MNLNLLIAVAAGYLLGSLSFAVITSRLMGLADPRSYGSGNPGATNVLRSGNKRAALLTLVFDALKRLSDWEPKQALMEAAGEPESCGEVWVQRAGLTAAEALDMLTRTTQHGIIPEPLRLAHIIAGGTTTGKSRGRT